MTCPICGRSIGVKDSIVDTEEGWAHKGCGEAGHVMLERPAPDTLKALADDVLAGLRVLNDADHLAERFGVPIPEAQLAARAANISMGLWGNYRIECRPGAEPVSAAGGDTEDLELPAGR